MLIFTSVTLQNQHMVYDNLYGKDKLPKRKNFKYEINQTVRISGSKHGFFTREFFTRWSEEGFSIYKRFRIDNINYYKLMDCSETVLQGSFHEQELSPATIQKYKIKQILDEKVMKGKKYILVQYENYPKSCAEWILRSSLTKA